MTDVQLTIVIATINDSDLPATVQSIRQTAGDKVKIVIVDDQSSVPIECPEADLVIHNRWQCGCAPSRHIGTTAADTDWVLFIDGHSRFLPGWLEAATERIASSDVETVWCATCIGLDAKNLDPTLPTCPRYHGATFNFHGPDRNVTNKMQVFEPVWMSPEPNDNQELPCVCGACYFVNRDWFLKIDPFSRLRYWGQDEAMLSFKTWLSGGSVRLMKNVGIGHKFWSPDDKPRTRKFFSVPPGVVLWNKLFAIHTLLPPDMAERMTERVQEVEGQEAVIAMALLKEHWATVEVERARNRPLFVRGIGWFGEKFGLTLP